MKIIHESPMQYDVEAKAEAVYKKFEDFLNDYKELTTMVGNYEAAGSLDDTNSRVGDILFTIREECGDIHRRTNDFLY